MLTFYLIEYGFLTRSFAELKHFQEFHFISKTNTADNQIKQLKSKPTKDLMMWDQFFQKLYFCSKTFLVQGFSSAKQKKEASPSNSPSELVSVPNSNLNRPF